MTEVVGNIIAVVQAVKGLVDTNRDSKRQAHMLIDQVTAFESPLDRLTSEFKEDHLQRLLPILNKLHTQCKGAQLFLTRYKNRNILSRVSNVNADNKEFLSRGEELSKLYQTLQTQMLTTVIESINHLDSQNQMMIEQLRDLKQMSSEIIRMVEEDADNTEEVAADVEALRKLVIANNRSDLVTYIQQIEQALSKIVVWVETSDSSDCPS